NITSDNITPLHLINVKRLAYELPREGRDAAAASAVSRPAAAAPPPPAASPASPPAPPVAPARPSGPAVDFVSEDDVRRAIRDGRTIRVAPKGIVTPSARDLAEGKQVLIEDPRPRS